MTKKLGLIRVSYGNLSAEKTLVVNFPLRAVLFSNEIILPVGQSFQLEILGGSLDYKYRVEPQSVADVDPTGLLNAK